MAVRFRSPALIIMQNLKFKSQNCNAKVKTVTQWILVISFSFCVLNFFGCATAPYVAPSVSRPSMPGKYHRVVKGETLWRISKIYNVDLEEIAKVNHISDSTSIEIGQSVFIPYGQTQKSVVVKYTGDEFIWPLKGKVTGTFGQVYNNMINKGINIQPYGSGDVVASRSGKVVFLNERFGGFGKTVIIDHGDGFSTVYAMNSQIFIKAGDSVQKGTVFAKATNLHFEIRRGHLPKNPLFYLP